MDKQRHPNVVRTWTVERTKARDPSPPPAKLKAKSRKDLYRVEESGPVRPPGRLRKGGR
jgi:hypothetical protein